MPAGTPGADAELVAISGDLTNDAEQAAYAALKERWQGLFRLPADARQP